MKAKSTTRNVTSDYQSHPDKLTNEEWSKLCKDAIDLYKSAVWQLADVIALGKKKFGRNNLVDITNLDIAKIRWLSAIANIHPRNPKLLPEHHQEVVGVKKVKAWLDLAVKHGWKPTELRKYIRQKLGESNKEPKINCPSYPKYTLLISNDLKRMTAQEKAKALEYITQQLNG